MFYAHFVLAKKGPLARIWLAAHWDKKLTKAHVFETNIEKSVDGILQPKVKMALRTSGHLLLGVVRIYSRKAKYLLADCNEAFVKIKMAFRPGMVDLPEDTREAAVSAITFPEVFHDFDTPMPELNDVDIQAQFTLNQSRAEEITMKEDFGSIPLVTNDDEFGEMGFGESSIMRDDMGQDLDQPNLTLGENIEKEKDKDQSSRLGANSSALDFEAPIAPIGGTLDTFLEGELFDEAPQPVETPSLVDGEMEKDKFPEDSDDDGGDLDRFGGLPSVGPPSTDGGSPCASPNAHIPVDDADGEKPTEPHEEPIAGDEQEGAATNAQDQTTLLHNEEESFALAPVDSSAIKSGWPRTKRKRKLIVDEVKNISGEEMKAQLSDTSDIVTALDLAPPSKRLMHWKETGGVEKLFALPGRTIYAGMLSKLYQRNLTSEHSHNEDFGMAGDKELENLGLEQVPDDNEVSVQRKGRSAKRKFVETDPIPIQPERVSSRRIFSPPPSETDMLSPPPVDLLHGSMEKDVSINELADESDANMALEQVSSPPPADTDIDMLSPPPVDLHSADDKDTPINESDTNILSKPDSPLPPPPPPSAEEDVFPVLSDDLQQGPDDNETPVNTSDVNEDEVQADDETYEEFEERVVNKRAGLLFRNIKKRLKQTDIAFSHLTVNNNRKQVAQTFYSLLVLKKLQSVELNQSGAYSEITISSGKLFEQAVH